MMKLFPELRRPWSDGLVSALGIQDYRDPFEIQFGLFGDDDGGGGGGSDNVDRSNPNEMAAREKAAARAGTVTDSSGNAVTSINSDGTRSVVTTGSQAQQVAAREAFNATDPRASDTRSNYAQDQYDQVRAQEDAALQRAAEAGRLASAPASSALANVGDVTQAQYGPFASDQPQLNFVAPQISRPEVNLSATSRPDIPANAQNMSNQILSRRVGSPAAFGIDTNIAMTALQDRALQGDVEAQDMLNQAATRGDITRDQADYAFGFTQQAPASAVGQTVAEAATAANVLQGTSPADMARIATADAAMDPSAVQVFDSSPNAMDAGDMMLNPGLATGLGSLPTPGGTVRDLQAQRQLQGPPQFIEESRTPARTISPTGQALEEVTGFLDYPGTVFDRPTSSLVQAGTTMGPQQARDANAFAAPAPTLGLSPGALGGRIAAPLPDMVDAETDMVARDLTDPNRAGYAGGLPTGLETYTRPDGVTLTTNLAGLTEEQRANQPFSMDVANFMGSQPYGYELDSQGNVIGQVGTPGMSLIGNAVTGLQNMIMGPPETVEDLLDRGAYTGMSLSGSDDGGGGDGGQQMQQATADPCPEGYQMVDGVCQPVDDVTADEPAAPGSNFVINPTTGLPTLFQPTTQATQVGQINPFVLQPYTPMQAQNIQQARSGIQALSPTGAALGRQV